MEEMLHFLKLREPSPAAKVAFRLYYFFLRDENSRRSLKTRDAIVADCALRVAEEIGIPIIGSPEQQKFLVAVRCVMDNIRRRDSQRQILTRSGAQLCPIAPKKKPYVRPPYQLKLKV